MDIEQRQIIQDANLLPKNRRLDFLWKACDGDNVRFLELKNALEQSLESAGYTTDSTIGRNVAKEAPLFFKSGMIDHFQVLGLVGIGGFGQVYRCRDTLSNRDVAIKVFPNEDTAGVGNSIYEAKANARVRHPQIAQLLHVGKTENADYLVFEFIDGRSLDEVIEDSNFSIATIVDVIREICSPLITIHEAGLTHRDLKPANVIINKEGKPVILDFGVAICESEIHELGEHVAGTQAYMSPEQFDSNISEIDGRADVWALGVMFYQLVTGCLPFKNQEAIYTGVFRPASMRNSRVPVWIDQVIRGCLSVDLHDRYSSVSALRDNINNNLKAAQDGGMVGHIENADDKKRNNTLLFAACILIPALLVAIYWGLHAGNGVEQNSESATSKDEITFDGEVENGSPAVHGGIPFGKADRIAAQWVLDTGGRICIDDFKSVRTLPEGPFDLVEIDFDSVRIDDSHLQKLSQFQLLKLQTIDLENTAVTNSGIRHLSVFTSLNDLTVSGTSVGDPSASYISEMKGLINLYADRTLFTDGGLNQLSELRLENFHLKSVSGITDKSIQALEKMSSTLQPGGLQIEGTGISKEAQDRILRLVDSR